MKLQLPTEFDVYLLFNKNKKRYSTDTDRLSHKDITQIIMPRILTCCTRDKEKVSEIYVTGMASNALQQMLQTIKLSSQPEP